MNAPHDDHGDDDPDADAHDPLLAAAGARLRADAHSLSADAIQLAVLHRRNRRLSAGLAAALVAILAIGAGTVALRNGDGSSNDLASNVKPVTADQRGKVEDLVARLAKKQPVDPRTVKLVSSVSQFADCDALIGDLRTVGAEHVGSRGFGANTGEVGFSAEMRSISKLDAAADSMRLTPYGPVASVANGGETLGTNVQVTGVDELDSVKAVGPLIYDLDGKGNLRITDGATLQVRSTLDVTPKAIGAPDKPKKDDPQPPPTSVSRLLVAGERVVIFGSESEISEPVKGDPSATRAETSYLTVTFVDATDIAKPKVTDRVRIEGGLVSARMVDGEVRLVTTSNMADLGFVMPTTPTSVAKALEQNRRSVASSTAADWIPDWQRASGEPQPLVPCDRVYVPDTFAGVAMTSMVTFPAGASRFEPAGTSILAPGSTLYAGLDKVAISSEVWVDPIDQERLEFDDWRTAVHEFRFSPGHAPGYEGSGIVDGSTIGQFAFGELGDSIAVVTSRGTPWSQDTTKLGVDLTVLTPGEKGRLDVASKVKDLSDGKGEVTAVRFVTDRVLVSTGLFGRQIIVIDVTDPTAPRRAGGVVVPGDVGYFHPLPDGRALVVGSRSDTVSIGKDKVSRSWVQAHLLDVTDADAPKLVATWERPWSADDVGSDHHAFTYWPNRKLAMWGISDTNWSQRDPNPNHAVVLDTDGGVQVALPVANQPNEVAPPCPSVPVPDDAQSMVGPDTIVLRCDDGATTSVDWPRYECSKVDKQLVARFVPEDQHEKAFFLCNPAPLPRVTRVLVVAGRPILLTDQTLEALDPKTFASTAIAYHPSSGAFFS
ncbi:MAG TPA: beta-propeller domain-containing protein [Acidimicrobiales bacterium]|nr:beta-propeller domain-containing protein [Acidimicrobiales bacterium]